MRNCNIIYIFLLYIFPTRLLCNPLEQDQSYNVAQVEGVSTLPDTISQSPARPGILESSNFRNSTLSSQEQPKDALASHQDLSIQKNMIIQSILHPKDHKNIAGQSFTLQESSEVWRSIVDDILKNNTFIELKPERWIDYMRVFLMAPFSKMDRKNLHLPIPQVYDEIFEELDNEYCLEHNTSTCLLKNIPNMSNTTSNISNTLPEHPSLSLQSYTFMNGENLFCLENWITFLLTQYFSSTDDKKMLLFLLKTPNLDPSVQRVLSKLKASFNPNPAPTENDHSSLHYSYSQTKPEKRPINLSENQRFHLSLSASESGHFPPLDSESISKFFSPEAIQEQQEQSLQSHHKTTTFLKKRGQKHDQ